MNHDRACRSASLTLVLAASLLSAACNDKTPTVATPAATPAAPSANAGPRYLAALAAIDPELPQLTRLVDSSSGPPRLKPEAAAQGIAWAQIANRLVAAKSAIDDLADATGEDRVVFPNAMGESMEGAQFLGECRGMYYLLRADAGRLLAEGKGDEGAARLAAALGLVRHMAQQEALIYSLTAAAIFAGIQGGIDALFGDAAADRLTPAQRETLLAAVNRMNAADPCGMVAARAREKAVDNASFASSEQQAKTGYDALRARLTR